MKQYPSNIKYKKNHKPSILNLKLKQQKLFSCNYGLLGLKSIENGFIAFNQIEACRKSIRRIMKKEGKLWMKNFTNISITKKSVASRMGSGKGSHSKWVSLIRKGQLICELMIPFEKLNLSIKALKSASSKLSLKTKIIKNQY